MSMGSGPTSGEGPKSDTQQAGAEATNAQDASPLANACFRDRFLQLGADAWQLTEDVIVRSAEKIGEGTDRIIEGAAALYGRADQAVRSGLYTAAQAAHVGSASILDALAPEAVDPATFRTQVQNIIPVVGAATRYANAWRIFHEGLEQNDEAKLGQARVQCVLAFAEAGIDLATFGLGPALRAGKLTGSMAKGVAAVRAAGVVDGRVSRITEGLANKMLGIPRVYNAVDAMLRTVKPHSKGQAEAAPAADAAAQDESGAGPS